MWDQNICRFPETPQCASGSQDTAVFNSNRAEARPSDENVVMATYQAQPGCKCFPEDRNHNTDQRVFFSVEQGDACQEVRAG